MVQTANPEINQIHVDVIIGQDISQPLNFSLVMANHQYPPSLTQPLFNLSQGTLPLVFLNQKISRFEIMENRRIKGAAVILGPAGWKGAEASEARLWMFGEYAEFRSRSASYAPNLAFRRIGSGSYCC